LADLLTVSTVFHLGRDWLDASATNSTVALSGTLTTQR
jgi:hypothetical protein